MRIEKRPGQARGKRRSRKAQERAWAAKNGPLTITKIGTYPHEPYLTPEYRAYMDSDQWRETRMAYFAIRPRVCVGCGSQSVQLHHLTYKRLGHEWWCDLLPLCEPCHERTHSGRITLLPPADLPATPIIQGVAAKKT